MSQRKNSAAPPKEVIDENDDEESLTNEQKQDDIGKVPGDSDEEELGRGDEQINLDQVSVKSNPTLKKKTAMPMEQPVQEETKQEPELDESAIRLNMKTQEGAKQAIKFKMRVFDYNYNFANDEMAADYDEEETD